MDEGGSVWMGEGNSAWEAGTGMGSLKWGRHSREDTPDCRAGVRSEQLGRWGR